MSPLLPRWLRSPRAARPRRCSRPWVEALEARLAPAGAETDLQVVSVARSPLYPRYAPTYQGHTVTEPSGFGPYTFSSSDGLGDGQTADTQRWPHVGDTVTY